MSQVKKWLVALLTALQGGGVSAWLDELTWIADSQRDPSATGLKRAGQGGRVVSIVITLVVASVIAYIGLIILSDVEETGDFADEGNSTFGNSSADLLSGVESVYGLMPVVFIALFVGVIIAALLSIRR